MQDLLCQANVMVGYICDLFRYLAREYDQESPKSQATSCLFLSEMIAKLEKTLSPTLQNKDLTRN